MNQINTIELKEIKFAIEYIFLEQAISHDSLKNLNIISQAIKTLDNDDKLSLSDYFYNHILPIDNVFSFYFFLVDMTNEARFWEKLEQETRNIQKIGDFYEVFWNISRRQFINPSDFKSEHCLRLKFHELSAKVKSYFGSDFLQKKPVQKIKRIAIFSPQILGMHHSPTREAFSMACHLKKYHDCEVFVFNTNALCYESTLGIYGGFIGNVNTSLDGVQELNIDYLEFKDEKINLVSFSAERIGMRKIIDVIEAVDNLDIDAVIAHSENLLIQDIIFGKIPSIFVTTGGTVPFAHSDAYWVPGNLLSESDELFANSYGHFNFLRESMMVTPESNSEAPLNKQEFDLPENSFTYLVVSTRLNAELEEEFVAVCEKLLKINDNARILFVGTASIELKNYFLNNLIENNRVINGGFQNDLSAVCLMCDAYLNPRRQGGGTSSQTAIMNGLPVVTLDYGHISAVVPEQYRHQDWDAYLAYASKICSDPDFLYNEKQVFLDHFTAKLQTKAQVDKIYATLTAIAESQYSQ